MSLLEVYAVGLLAVLIGMTALWLVSLIVRDSSIVDIFWGPGFVMLAWIYFALTDGFVGRKVLIAGLTTIWGLRLGVHILLRNWGKGEDFRYAAWRQEYGRRWWWYSYLQTFLLQGGLMVSISAPLLFAQFYPMPARLTAFDFVGVAIWLIGFIFETVGDWQLARFKRNPANRGRVLDTGLWRFTRHPNYFGDAAQWWGYFLIALATPLGFLSAFSPILMTFLLLRVSGVAMLEKTLAVTRPEYRDYIQRTSAFFPLPPRSR